MTEEMKDNKGVSLFSRSRMSFETDPIEEIFALNLGDFVSEHLISDELVKKISKANINKIESVKNQLKELISIYSIDNTLKILGFSEKEDYIIYNAIAKTIKQMLDIDACHIFLTKNNALGLASSSNDLVLAGSSLNFNDDIYRANIGYRYNDGSCAVKAFSSGEIQEITDCNKSDDFRAVLMLNEDRTVYYLAVPMCSSMEKAGVIAVENYTEKKLSDEFIELLSVTARLFAVSMNLKHLTEEAENLINLENASIHELQNKRAELTALIGDLSSEQQQFVEHLAKAVDAKSSLKSDYSREAADLSREIASKIGLNEKTKDLIYYAALLRNIGKITLPENLFNKKEKLTDDDLEQIQKHPNAGVSILMSINFLSEVVPYINYHKELWNGTGKPEGLKGMSIPLGCRIIAAADAYCALTSKRSYREAMSTEQALKILKSEAGSKWDPDIIDILCALKAG